MNEPPMEWDALIAAVGRWVLAHKVEAVFCPADLVKADTMVVIIAAVSGYYGLQPGDLTGRRRPAHIAWPRFVACAMCREFTGASYNEIGLALGKRDHGTVMHGVRQVNEQSRLIPNSKIIRQVQEVRAKLREILKTDEPTKQQPPAPQSAA
jgi:chromosomal replication initiation ATPase DnaA